jgi:RNA polymerase subunit RPABC4/transcription elongation factor Spt4
MQHYIECRNCKRVIGVNVYISIPQGWDFLDTSPQKEECPNCGSEDIVYTSGV